MMIGKIIIMLVMFAAGVYVGVNIDLSIEAVLEPDDFEATVACNSYSMGDKIDCNDTARGEYIDEFTPIYQNGVYVFNHSNKLKVHRLLVDCTRFNCTNKLIMKGDTNNFVEIIEKSDLVAWIDEVKKKK